MPTIVGFISQKGSVSKSTLARALATEATKEKLKTIIIDIDDLQNTSVKWMERRQDYLSLYPNKEHFMPLFDVIRTDNLRKAIQEAQNSDLILIDGPGRGTKLSLEIAKASDLVIQPVAPSLDDLEPNIALYDEIANRGVETRKLYFAICRAGSDAEAAEAREYLNELDSPGPYPILPGYLPEKTGYRKIQNEGRAITEAIHPSLRIKANKYIQGIADTLNNF